MRNLGKEGIDLISVRTEIHRGKSLVRKRRSVLATVGKSCALFLICRESLRKYNIEIMPMMASCFKIHCRAAEYTSKS